MKKRRDRWAEDGSWSEKAEGREEEGQFKTRQRRRRQRRRRRRSRRRRSSSSLLNYSH
jgi:hypothetical protein